MFSFGEYLKLHELATTSANIAVFARPLAMVRRTFAVLGGDDPFTGPPVMMSFEDDKKKKKKKKKK